MRSNVSLKIITFILLATSLLILCSLGTHALYRGSQNMYFVFAADDFESNTSAYSLTSDLELTYNNDSLSDYVTLSATAGDYGNSSLLFKLKSSGLIVDPIEHHYIKIAYKTNLTHSGAMIDLNCKKGDSWLTKGVKFTSDEEWHEAIFDLEDVLNNSSASKYPDENDKSTTMTFKFWGSHDKTLANDQYLSIRYIAFFETEAEANSYSFDERFVFDANDFKYNDKAYTLSNDVTFEFDSDSTSDFVSLKIQPGEFVNNDGMLAFEAGALEVNPMVRHFVKIGYKTNTSAWSQIDFNCSKGDSWLKNQFRLNNDGAWHDIVIDFENALLSGVAEKYPEPTDPRTVIRFKLFGSHRGTVSNAETISIRYMAFFETLEEANAFTYEPMDEEEYLSLYPFEATDLRDAKEAEIREYLANAEALKEAIINYPGTVEVNGTKYYVSSSIGNDNNDGLSPEKPWKTLNKVNSFKFNSGDGVYFKRGDIWRESLKTKNGVTYSAYSTGAKPAFYGSIDGLGAEKWSATDYDNLWVYEENFSQRSDGRFPANIVFNNETAWGVIITEDSSKPGYTVNRGSCWNGYEMVDNTQVEMTDLTFIRENLEYYYDSETGRLYMYFDKGNPGEYFDTIEICLSGNGINSIGGSTNVVIDNICLKYFANHGVSGFNTNNFTVQYCVIGFIGGNGLGNAIESWTNANNYYVHHNYAYQCYDCAFTAQGTVTTASVTIKNVTMHDNIAEYCNSGLEFWLGTGDAPYNNGYRGVMKDIDLYDNYTLYGGYGWSNQRPGKDHNFFYGGVGKSNTLYENIKLHHNVNMFTRKIGIYSLYVSENGGFDFSDNIYFQTKNNATSHAARYLEDFMTGTPRPYAPTLYNITRLANFGVEQGSKYRIISENYLPFTFNGVYDIYPGDINGDGELMPDDEIILARYLAICERGDTVYLAKNADFDEDGTVTPVDAALLARAIAGYAS